MFGSKNTVDSVITRLTSVVTDLEAVALSNREVAHDKAITAAQLNSESHEASREAERADKIVAKFADLLEM